MKKRVRTKIGDIFSVKVADNEKKYFQLIAFDLTQLNSDVIRAFKKVHRLEENPKLEEIVSGEVEFYAHCVTNLGVKLLQWDKVGYIQEVGNTSNILFRDTNDYGAMIEGKPKETSDNWYVWHINDKDFTHVGKLKGANQKAEIGIIVNPYDIVDHMRTGEYDFLYIYFS